jgi:hypothetical protein
MLLRLPTELIQLILLHCETPDFFQAARTNRRLYDIARSSREVILHQLNHTPGFINGLEFFPTTQLYVTLRTRSNAQLYGAESSADFTTHRFSNQVVNSLASVFERPRESNRALLAFKNHSTVYLVKVENGTLSQEASWKSPGQDIGEVEVMHTAFNGEHGIYVLHRFKPFSDQNIDINHPFVKHAQQSHPNGSVFLAYHDLNSDKTVRMCAFPEHDGYRPLALSVSGSQFAISWQNTQDISDHTVVLYQLLDSEDENEDSDSMDEDAEEKKTQSCKITRSLD